MYQFTGQGQDLLAQARQMHTDSNDARFKRDFQKAARLLETALKLRRTALISPHAVLTATVDSLAHLYQEMGEFKQWRDYAKLAVEEKVAMLGELHMETQSSLDNLHDACIACGDFEGAAEARQRNWNARTSTLGVKDEKYFKTDGLVGDIERMLDYWREMKPSIRTSTQTATEGSRLRNHDGLISADRQAAVTAAQAATNALMHCDFNDRRPVKRDPELSQLLVDRMSKADYLMTFKRKPDERWIRGDDTIWRDPNTGEPGTPPVLNPLKAPAGSVAAAGAAAASGPTLPGDSKASESGAAPTDSLAAPEDEEEVAPPEGDYDEEGAEDGEAPPEYDEEGGEEEGPPAE